ncbi:MAG: hypothetical protein ACTSRB_03575 [Candidatus Helarchaeota archaeon]
MDEYDEFSMSLALRMAVVCGAGVGFSILGSMVSIWIFNSQVALNMIDLIFQFVALSGRIPAELLIMLTFTVVSLVAPSINVIMQMFFQPFMITKGITTHELFSITISSVITWIVVGIVVGILSKHWFQGLQNTLITGILHYIIDAILLIVVVAISGNLFTGIVTYGIIYIAFVLVLLFAIPNFLVLMVSGAAGGIIGQYVVFKDRY